MSYRVEDIAHEAGRYWVLRDRKQKCYTVFKSGITHSIGDSAYPLTADGLSLAKARADYLNKAMP